MKYTRQACSRPHIATIFSRRSFVVTGNDVAAPAAITALTKRRPACRQKKGSP
jgi:hypothetical protein